MANLYYFTLGFWGHMKKSIIFTSVLLLISACNESEIKVRSSIEATSTINPNIIKKASPVEIRVFHLRSNKKFENANYSQLVNDYNRTLGSDLLHSETFVIRPGQKVPYNSNIHKDSKFIGVAAAFRQYNISQWKIIKPVSLFRVDWFVIKINNNEIYFENEEK